MELSICPDIGAQDALGGAVIASEKLSPIHALSGTIAVKYAAVKKKTRVMAELRGRLIAAHVSAISKKKITVKFATPVYLVAPNAKICLYRAGSGELIALVNS